MNYRAGVLTGFLFSALFFGSGVAVWWLMQPKPTPPAKSTTTPPAKVPKTVKEDQLNTITLSEEAMKTLQVNTAPVERKTMRPMRLYGGELVIPTGQDIIVSAPLGGTLQVARAGMARPGQTVKKGQIMMHLLPLYSPEGQANLTTAQIDAEGQINTARSQVEAARIALERAQRLFKGEAGSRKAVDDAQALFDIAEKTLQAALARKKTLDQVLKQVEKGTAAAIPLEAPADGVIRTVSAVSGQNVPAGATLFEVIDINRMWVRVPVYVGDHAMINAQGKADIGPLTARPGDVSQPATPIAAPPTANPTTGTVDLYYELDNHKSRYSPGQRVAVRLPLKGDETNLVLPWSAVLHDVYGNTWVYEQTGERTFVRRRVLVHHVDGPLAVLSDGPEKGAKIVTAGAAELFGAETGFTK